MRGRSVTFGAVCAGCPLRVRCTAKDGRSLDIHPHEHLLRAARARAQGVPHVDAHGCDVGVIDQELPFHHSASVVAVAVVPTAMHALAETHEMPLSVIWLT